MLKPDPPALAAAVRQKRRTAPYCVKIAQKHLEEFAAVLYSPVGEFAWKQLSGGYSRQYFGDRARVPIANVPVSQIALAVF